MGLYIDISNTNGEKSFELNVALILRFLDSIGIKNSYLIFSRKDNLWGRTMQVVIYSPRKPSIEQWDELLFLRNADEFYKIEFYISPVRPIRDADLLELCEVRESYDELGKVVTIRHMFSRDVAYCGINSSNKRKRALHFLKAKMNGRKF